MPQSPDAILCMFNDFFTDLDLLFNFTDEVRDQLVSKGPGKQMQDNYITQNQSSSSVQSLFCTTLSGFIRMQLMDKLQCSDVFCSLSRWEGSVPLGFVLVLDAKHLRLIGCGLFLLFEEFWQAVAVDQDVSLPFSVQSEDAFHQPQYEIGLSPLVLGDK